MKPCLLIFRITILFISSSVFSQQSISNDWPKATPQSQEMNADLLNEFSKQIADGKYGNVDEMFVTRNGKLIFQQTYQHDYQKIYGVQAKQKDGLNQKNSGGPLNYYNAWWHPYYHNTDLHTLQSVTKTITSVIIGVAINRNVFPSIETPVLNFFDTTKVQNIDARKRKLTIRHLLTMTAGFDWNEQLPYSDPRNDAIVMEGSCDWIDYVINKPMSEEPGERFNYNSGASELLSYIFQKATGSDIEEYAAKYLFTPLSVTEFYWKRTPSGLVDSEGGLYLKASDLAKIWYMVLQEGNWKGQTILNKQWIKESVSPAITVNGNTKYGYKWWLFPYGNNPVKYAWFGNGFGGQWPIIIPEYNIVAVFTGWNISGSGKFLQVGEAIKRLTDAVEKK